MTRTEKAALIASGTNLVLSGLKFGLAFITLNPLSPSGIQVVSARRQVEVK